MKLTLCRRIIRLNLRSVVITMCLMVLMCLLLALILVVMSLLVSLMVGIFCRLLLKVRSMTLRCMVGL